MQMKENFAISYKHVIRIKKFYVASGKRIFELSLRFHHNKGFTLFGALFLASGIILALIFSI